MWSVARPRGLSFDRLAEWLAAAPARLAGVGARKGAIAPGFDADFVVWNPEQTFEVHPESLHHRHKLSPYLGRTLSGVVESTYLAGEKIFERGELLVTSTGNFSLRRVQVKTCPRV